MKVSAGYLERVAKDWQSAYAKAHEKTPPPVTWEKGWFTIQTYRRPKYRRAQLEQMTKVLRKGFTEDSAPGNSEIQ